VDRVHVDATPLEGDAAPLGDHLARYIIAHARALPLQETALFVFGGEPVVNLRATYERAWADDDELAEQNAGGRSHEDAPEALDVPNDVQPDDVAALHELLRGVSPGPRWSVPPTSIDEPMRGGRMQLLALSAALALEEAAAAGDMAAWRITLLAAGTDGRDGPTDAAGAIVDAAIPALARRHGRRPERDLATGRSWFPLDAAQALLRTGPTGTNVMDIVAVYVRRAAR
jgi:hydroxypyruvate reductase